MKFVLAPLAGFTNAPLRLLCRAYGADWTYTEMVSAAGLAYGSSPTRHLMETLPGEGPVVCQIFGAHPEHLAFAAEEATALGRFAGLDLNAGCPMPNIVREGAGAALGAKPENVYRALCAMTRATTLPVTLKTRPGPRPDRILLDELIGAAASAGCKGLTLHARFTSQKHAGHVHLELLAECVRKAPFPVIGNGSVTNAASAAHMAQTGVSAIMVGRAALARPWIFRALKNPDASGAPDGAHVLALQDDAFARHLAALETFHARLKARFPHDPLGTCDAFVLAGLRTQLFRYFSGRPGAAELRRRLNTLKTRADIDACLAALRTPPQGNAAP